MNKKLKYLFGLLITPLLCLGVSFGYSVDLNTFDYVGNYGHDYVDGSNMNNNYTINVSLSSDKLYCVAVKSFKCEYPTMWGGGNCSYNIDLNLNNTDHTFSYIFGNSVVINASSHINIPDSIGDVWCFLSEANGFASFSQLPDYVGFKFDLYSKDIFTIGSSDCSEFESDLSTCKSLYNTLSGNYATCQSNLASCQGSNCDTQLSQCLLDNDTLSGNLSNCVQDKNSLQNANDSLTLQLQECLGQACSGTGDSLTGMFFNQYNLFWSDELVDYSLPITNNLFLPDGYKGKLNEDNVLTIAKINTLEKAYQFSEEDKITIIDIVSIVVLFLLTTGIIILVILFLKRLVLKK